MKKYQYCTQSSNYKERKKGKKRVLRDLEMAIENENFEEIIIILKASGYLINETRDNTSEANEMIEKCDMNIKNNKWPTYKRKLLLETKILNDVLNKIKSKLDQISNDLPENMRTYYYLISLEAAARECINYVDNHNIGDIDIKQLYLNEELINMYAETSGIVLRYLCYHEKLNENIIKIILNTPVKFELVEHSYNYIVLADLWRGVKENIDVWTYGNLDITVENDEVTLNSKCDETLERAICDISYNDISNAKQYKLEIAQCFVHFYKKLPIVNKSVKKDLNMSFNKDNIEDLLFMDIEEKLKCGISIKNMLIAYDAIKILSDNRIKKDGKTFRVMTLRDIAFVEEKEYWITHFVKSGVSKSEVYAIFDMIVFSDSRDLLDCPLYKMGKYYILLPSIGSMINSSKAMLSNFNKRGVDISFKGRVFENHLKKIVEKTKCKCTSYYKKIDKDEYQSDLIFEIDGHVIFIEAKNMSPVNSFRDYIINKERLHDACDQVNRVADYILKNEKLESVLNINEVKSISKMIVSSIPIGKNEMYNGVLITDEIYFSGYMLRKAPAVNHFDHQNKKYITYRLYTEYYSGELSIEQFKSLIQSDPIKESVKSQRIIESEFRNEEFKLIHEFYNVGTPSLLIGAENSPENIKKFV